MHTSRTVLMGLVFLMAFSCAAQAADREPGIPPDVPMRSIFSNYRYGGVDWDALGDPHNDVLLRASVGGAPHSELASLGISDLDERLKTLERGKLLKQADGRYRLNFPVIAGDTHAQLRSCISPAATALLPAARDAAGQITRHLANDEEMLYHLLWSWMMDGSVAWAVLKAQLRSELQTEAVDLATCWWLYPRHPYHAGTNSYMSAGVGLVAITWSDSTASPVDVRAALSADDNRFLLATIKQGSMAADDVTARLGAYGFVDEAGRSRLFVLTPASPLAPVLLQSSGRFAQLAMRHLNVPEVARQLRMTPEQALVIVYHELCYELLGRLHEAGDLRIPGTTPENRKATRRLVALLPITSEAQREHLEQLFQKSIER